MGDMLLSRTFDSACGYRKLKRVSELQGEQNMSKVDSRINTIAYRTEKIGDPWRPVTDTMSSDVRLQ